MNDFKINILKKVCKIIGDDGRNFYGKIILIDKEGNLVLNQVLCEMPKDKISSLSNKIENLFNKISIMNELEEFNKTFSFNLKTEEEFKEFIKDKFYINGIVIKRVNIKKLFLLN